MRYSRKQYLSSYATLLLLLLVSLSISKSGTGSVDLVIRNTQTAYVLHGSAWERQIKQPTTMISRIATRLFVRLRKKGIPSPSVDVLSSAIEQRQEYLRRHTLVSITHPDGTEFLDWEASIHKYPQWLKPSISLLHARFILDDDEIRKTIMLEVDSKIVKPSNISIEGTGNEGNVLKVNTSGLAKKGEEIDIDALVDNVKFALESGSEIVLASLYNSDPIIDNIGDENLGSFELIASGKSNFKGSTYNRSFNVRKALREHVNNTLVPPGATFSFNDTLNGPVSLGNGWAMAKVIYNGNELKPAPGGGICQASTTVYRAAVMAGLPIEDRRSHSMYVSYYKAYGVGIDATIYPGTQDLSFVNDTGNYILIQSYDDGYDAVVNIYGTPDGRTVELEGPYFTTNSPTDLKVNGRHIMGNEIAWIQYVNRVNQEQEKNMIVSRYNALPSYVKNQYETLHASGPVSLRD
ncbi:VanW family protein [Candidatus Peregrinibacteria bacterium]|jgi:hypothetical protein|nr:VanW family protein [Candidatus Peregrinibacteria bacterium]MBT3598313.1 VanW family protein [Candidatus Peregrinibacteria bacterium]MBT4367037.1 VanW family protein [Candidatus Peregrinibacteria bacterium]MBT4585721.1 VanW family protein [Candidatus Peregrinibacteria bacterium]MBT6730525.1 VanW family protein [Candidatus Peregrinibacteria bacterium]